MAIITPTKDKKLVVKMIMKMRENAGVGSKLFANLTEEEHSILYKEFVQDGNAFEDFPNKRDYYKVKHSALDKVFNGSIMKVVNV